MSIVCLAWSQHYEYSDIPHASSLWRCVHTDMLFHYNGDILRNAVRPDDLRNVFGILPEHVREHCPAQPCLRVTQCRYRSPYCYSCVIANIATQWKEGRTNVETKV